MAMTTEKLDIAELKRLRGIYLGLASENGNAGAAWCEYVGCMLNYADELIALAERQHNRDTHIGTHSDNCYSFGYQHYSCALREIERIKAENAELRKDALRYRYLRTELSAERRLSMWPKNGDVWVVKYIHFAGTIPEVRSAGSGAELDANIDWAMANIQKESGNG